MRSKRRRRRKSGCLFRIFISVLIVCGLGIGCVMLITKIDENVLQRASVPYEEITIDEDELCQKFYYGKIDNEEHTAYQEILQGIRENKEEIYVHSDDAKRTNQLFEYVLKDFPEIFWCDGTASTTLYEEKELYTVLRPVYLYENEEKENKKEEINQAVELFLNTVPQDADDYDKILMVYEYIVNNVDYDMEASDNQNIYSVFINKKSVCAGYSKATQYLLEKMGVFCTYVTGKTSGNQNHAWNLVSCDGSYYYVDTTWGDPVFQGEEQGNIENISYDFMCCDETQISKTHTPDEDIELPECNQMDKNYYVVNDMYYTAYDDQIILQKMNETISAGKNPSVFKFSDQEMYQEAESDIFKNIIEKAAQNLAKWYGLNKVYYQYMNDPELNKITIYWQYE